MEYCKFYTATRIHFLFYEARAGELSTYNFNSAGGEAGISMVSEHPTGFGE